MAAGHNEIYIIEEIIHFMIFERATTIVCTFNESAHYKSHTWAILALFRSADQKLKDRFSTCSVKTGKFVLIYGQVYNIIAKNSRDGCNSYRDLQTMEDSNEISISKKKSYDAKNSKIDKPVLIPLRAKARLLQWVIFFSSL